MNPLMSNTKWEELRRAMLDLETLSPQWRTKITDSGYICPWDGEWFYHFKDGGYQDIEWVEIRVTSSEQDEAVLNALKTIHVPGHRVENGFRIYGYSKDGEFIDYI